MYTENRIDEREMVGEQSENKRYRGAGRMAGDNDALFALECLVAEHAGQWPPDGPAHVPEEWQHTSPVVSAAYARYLAGQGRIGESRDALTRAVRSFARQGAEVELRAAMGALACLDLTLGEREDAMTALRFLREETQADVHADVLYALGRCGYLVGMTLTERLTALAAAAAAFANEKLANRALTALFEWRRQVDAAGSDEAAAIESQLKGLRLRFVQKATWSDDYKWHAALLDHEQADWRSVLLEDPHMPSAQSTVSRSAPPLDAYSKLLARAEMLRRKLCQLQPLATADVRSCISDIEQQYFWAIELQAERMLLLAALCHAEGDGAGALAALRELEPLFTMGLAPEYRNHAAELADLPVDAIKPVDLPVADYRPIPQHQAKHTEGIRVYCFGGVRLERLSEPLPELRWRRKKAQELFHLLLLRSGHAMPKEQAIDLLYGEVDPAKAANKLYVAIHEVNRALRECCGLEVMMLRDGVIVLAPEAIEEVDVEKYATLIRVADQLQNTDPSLSEELYIKAVELYGDLLPHLPYVEWLSRYRDELETKQFRALERLVEAARKRGDIEGEGRFLRERYELTPLQEDAVQALLQYCVRAGKRSEAVRLYDSFASRLATEFDCAPLPETTHIIGCL